MATDWCLKWSRNSLLLSCVENIINEDEFALLYELNNSKEIYPFWKYDKFDFENMDKAQCKREFLFLCSHTYDLKKNKYSRENSYLSENSKFQSWCAMHLILLKWLAFPCWYTNMVPTFGEKWNRIVPIYNHMLNYIYTQHHHRLQSWNQYFYSQQSLKSMLMSYMKKLHHLKTVLALLTVL